MVAGDSHSHSMKIQDDPYYKAGFIDGALTMIGIILLVGGFVWLMG